MLYNKIIFLLAFASLNQVLKWTKISNIIISSQKYSVSSVSTYLFQIIMEGILLHRLISVPSP